MRKAGVHLEQDKKNEQLVRALVELRELDLTRVSDSANSYDVLHAEGKLRQRDSFYKWLSVSCSPRPAGVAGRFLGQGALLKVCPGGRPVVAAWTFRPRRWLWPERKRRGRAVWWWPMPSSCPTPTAALTV